MDLLNLPTGIDLYAFLDTYGGTRAKQEALLFWALHPNTKFSRLAVLSAMECSRIEVERALKDMVEAGLVDMHSYNGLVTYSLTSNQNMRQMVTLFSTLDWGQRRVVCDHAHLMHSS